MELDEVYPLSQHETALPLDKETIEYVANQIVDYINRTNYKRIILINNTEHWNKTILNTCKKTCKTKNIKFKSLDANTANLTKRLEAALQN